MSKLHYLVPIAALMLASCAGTAQKESTPATADNAQAAESATTAALPAAPDSSDVITFPSGLAIQVLTPSEGPIPSSTADVSVTYTGYLTDGKIFDQSDTPVTFNLMQVIPGFREGISAMHQGSTCRLYIPSDLGYGPTGVQGVIPPNADLIFDVTLVSFN